MELEALIKDGSTEAFHKVKLFERFKAFDIIDQAENIFLLVKALTFCLFTIGTLVIYPSMLSALKPAKKEQNDKKK